MKIISGNIINCEELLIIHQVNCMNTMGAGVAKALYTQWPTVKTEYHKFCDTHKKMDLLGMVNVVYVPKKIIFNAFSQYFCGTEAVYTNYPAVNSCFTYAASKMNELKIDNIALPYGYGCGLAGGDWNVVSELIENIFGDAAVCYKLNT